MNITFVYPDFESLGVEYLMAVCSSAGHNVNFVYYEAEDTYIGRKNKSLSLKSVAEEICSKNPDVAAFSCVTDNYQYQLSVAEVLKKTNNDIYTIFGGVHVTAVPQKVLRKDAVDSIAIGEAEISLPDFLEKSESNSQMMLPDLSVEGIIFKKGGSLVGSASERFVHNLSQLPFPSKGPFLSSLRGPQYEYRIMTSRGCPYRCSYCFNSFNKQLQTGVKLRRRAIQNVIDELVWAKKKFEIRYVLFLDDSFTTEKEWIKEFCNIYTKKVCLPFACIANPHYIDEKVSSALGSAGCISIQMGIQSLSPSLCKKILKRKSNNNEIVKAINCLKANNIMVQVDHMLGIPGDSIKIQEESVRFYNAHRPNLISIFWLTYYPKTEILNDAERIGLVKQEEIDMIEEGLKLTEESYLSGGSLKDPRPYLGISFILNWLPILPKWIVSFLIESRIYRFLRIKNYYISTAFPRVIQSVLNRKDFRGRSHIYRFLDKII